MEKVLWETKITHDFAAIGLPLQRVLLTVKKHRLSLNDPFMVYIRVAVTRVFFCLLNTKTTHDIIHTYSYFSFALCDTGCHRCSLFIMSNKFLHFK